MDTENLTDSSPTTTAAVASKMTDAEYMEEFKSNAVYKAKLVSLLLLRLVNDDRVEEFRLDMSVHFWSFIYLQVKIKGLERPMIVVLHVSHCIDPSTERARSILNDMHTLTDMSSPSLAHWVAKSGRMLKDYDYLYVRYTNLRVSTISTKMKPYRCRFAEHLNTLLCTGVDNIQGVHVDCTDNEKRKAEHETFVEIEMWRLAQHLFKFLGDESMHIMQDEYIERYHVLLAQRVVHISDILTEGSIRYRELTFRPDFILTKQLTDKNLTTLRHLLTVLAQEATLKDDSCTIDCEETLLRQKMNQINCYNTTVDDLLSMMEDAAYIARKKLYMPLKLKVPVTFGNTDLVLTGDSVEKNRRIELLAQFIVNLCQTSIASGEYNVVIIDESEGRDYPGVEDGIGSAIGNLFVYDKATELLKFTENVEALQDNARALYDKLNSSSIADSLSTYRFNARTIKHFPKLEFDSLEDYKAELYKHCVLYGQQSDHDELENILKEEIERHFTDEQNVSVPTDKIFMYCLSAVQEWCEAEDDDDERRKSLTKFGFTQKWR